MSLLGEVLDSYTSVVPANRQEALSDLRYTCMVASDLCLTLAGVLPERQPVLDALRESFDFIETKGYCDPIKSGEALTYIENVVPRELLNAVVEAIQDNLRQQLR